MHQQNIIESSTLHFQEGGSDKVYIANVVCKDNNKYSVEFSYGRRDGALKHGEKVSDADIASATSCYRKLIDEKIKKGYVAIAGDPKTLVTTAKHTEKSSGYRPQLLRQVKDSEIPALYLQDGVVIQQKMDGERRMLIKENEVVYGSNRRGITIPLPENIYKEFSELPDGTVLDGEIITVTTEDRLIGKEVVHVFDVLKFAGADLQSKPFSNRLSYFSNYLTNKNHSLRIVEYVSGSKRASYVDKLLENGAEGIVIRRTNDVYEPGKNNKQNATPAKHKFYNTASVIVVSHNERHSIEMGLYESDELKGFGNVTIAPSLPLPRLGSVIEVRYLYAFKGGNLYQTTYLQDRTDVENIECTVHQLSYKT